MAPATDPFAATHGSPCSVSVDDPRVAKEAILVMGETQFVVLRVEHFPVGVYVEWMVLAESVQKTGLLFDPKTRLCIRPLNAPVLPKRSELTFVGAVTAGYYTTRLPMGKVGTPERLAYVKDQQRLNDEFRADLETENGTSGLPETLRIQLFEPLYAWAAEFRPSSVLMEVVRRYPESVRLARLAYDYGSLYGSEGWPLKFS